MKKLQNIDRVRNKFRVRLLNQAISKLLDTETQAVSYRDRIKGDIALIKEAFPKLDLPCRVTDDQFLLLQGSYDLHHDIKDLIRPLSLVVDESGNGGRVQVRDMVGAYLADRYEGYVEYQ